MWCECETTRWGERAAVIRIELASDDDVARFEAMMAVVVRRLTHSTSRRVP